MSTQSIHSKQLRSSQKPQRYSRSTVLRRYLLCAIALVTNISCSWFLDFPEQCRTDADCRRRGGPLSVGLCELGVCQVSDVGPRSNALSEPPGQATNGSEDGTDITATADEIGAAPVLPPGQPAVTGEAAMIPEGPMTVPSSVPEGTVPSAASPSDQNAPDGIAEQPSDVAPDCVVDADCVADTGAAERCIAGTCWPVSPECGTDMDCLAMGPEYEGGRCRDSVCEPNPLFRCEGPGIESPDETTQLSLLVRDSLSLSAIAGIDARICQKLDVQCASPVTTGTTDRDGILTFDVKENFSGYVQVESDSYFPALYFVPPTLPADGQLQPFPLLPGGIIIDGLAISLGTELLPDRGHMMIIAEDCMGTALSGVRISSEQGDDETVLFYVRDLLPTATVTETGDIGNGGYLNFPAGNALISLTLVERDLALTTATVVVRPGFISVAYLRPDPHMVVVP